MANWTPEGLPGQMFKLVTKYLPPPDMPPPVLWGVPDKVRERFGDRVLDLTMTPVMADMVFSMTPAEVVEHFRQYFGPTQMAFKAFPKTSTKPTAATSNPSLPQTTSRQMEPRMRRVSFWKCER